MAQDFKEIVAEFFEKHGAKYPELNLEQYTNICRAPFMFFKKMMESMDFPQINIKYFGKFVVWPGSVKGILERLQIMKQEGRLTQEQFDKKSVHLKGYLNGYENQNPVNSHRGETPD